MTVILAFVLGMVFGSGGLIAVCCILASADHKEPKDKDEWRGLP